MKYNILIILILAISVRLYSQEGEPKKDSVIKLVSDKPVPSGIFLSANIGIDIPFQKFSENSSTALILGARLEYASLKIYPVVIGVSYQYQSNPGGDEFKTVNLLNSFDTKIHSFGIGFDVILNKYLKSSFTIPFLTLELKYLSAKREISPEGALPELLREESIIGFSGGLGFTLFIFDIYGTYNYAKDYSSISVRTRVRIPVLKL